MTLHRSLCGSLKDRLDLTWLKNVDPTLKKHCNHVVCIVHDIDNKSYIVDVGLGDGPPEPFELIGTVAAVLSVRAVTVSAVVTPAALSHL